MLWLSLAATHTRRAVSSRLRYVCRGQTSNEIWGGGRPGGWLQSQSPSFIDVYWCSLMIDVHGPFMGYSVHNVFPIFSRLQAESLQILVLQERRQEAEKRKLEEAERRKQVQWCALVLTPICMDILQEHTRTLSRCRSVLSESEESRWEESENVLPLQIACVTFVYICSTATPHLRATRRWVMYTVSPCN